MDIVVFGATGMVGTELVKQALNKGHRVRAFGRNVYTAEFRPNENLQLVKGTLFDDEEVYHAVKGCTAVLSALGGGINGTDKTRSLGMKHIVAQMQRAGIDRIIAVGGLGLLDNDAADDEDDAAFLMDSKTFPNEYYAVSKEHYAAYEYLKESSLNWTVVCPPNIALGGPTGLFKTAADVPPQPNNFRITAGDLALFMLQELEKNQYLQKRVGISN